MTRAGPPHSRRHPLHARGLVISRGDRGRGVQDAWASLRAESARLRLLATQQAALPGVSAQVCEEGHLDHSQASPLIYETAVATVGPAAWRRSSRRLSLPSPGALPVAELVPSVEPRPETAAARSPHGLGDDGQSRAERLRYIMNLLTHVSSQTDTVDLTPAFVRLSQVAHREQERVINRAIAASLVERPVTGDTDCCAICLQEMATGDAAVHLECSHRFHGDCIRKACTERPACPLCRRAIPMDKGRSEDP